MSRTSDSWWPRLGPSEQGGRTSPSGAVRSGQSGSQDGGPAQAARYTPPASARVRITAKEAPMPAAKTERSISDATGSDGRVSATVDAGPLATASGEAPVSPVVCWFQGKFQPLADARISVMTHGFLYGTGIFEGIRAYWNADQGQLYGLKLVEHFTRLVKNCKLMLMEPPGTPSELVDLTVELLRRNGWREDVYVRPTVYKSTEAIGVRLHNLENDFVL